MTRKKRCDRAYLIYRIVCTVTQECYVGLVVRQGQGIRKTLSCRLHQHVTRAYSLGKEWTLHQAIRRHGHESFDIGLLEIVRGKAAAHNREVQLMQGHRATLNTKMEKR